MKWRRYIRLTMTASPICLMPRTTALSERHDAMAPAAEAAPPSPRYAAIPRYWL